MSEFAGQFFGKPVDPQLGMSKGKYKVRVEFEIVDEGPHKGKRARYDGKLDEENIKFTKRDMVSMGWQGKSASTFVEDVKRANKTMPITVEQASYTYPDTGKTSTWAAVRLSGGQPLAKLESEQLRNLDRWFAEAGEVAGAPPSNGAADDSDIPF